MKWLRFTFLVLAAAVLGASALMETVSLTERHIKPDILLILLVYFATNCNSYDAIISSFALGFAADITGTLIGPHLISFGIIGTALTYIRKIILLRKTGQQALAIFTTGIFIQLLTVILAKLKFSTAATGGFLEIFAVSAYSAILWFLIRWPVIAIGKWLGVGVHRFGTKASER